MYDRLSGSRETPFRYEKILLNSTPPPANFAHFTRFFRGFLNFLLHFFHLAFFSLYSVSSHVGVTVTPVPGMMNV